MKTLIKKTIAISMSILLIGSVPLTTISNGYVKENKGSVTAVETKYVSITRKYKRGTRVPASIPYQQDGFGGYLKRASRYSYVEGDYIFWNFSGTVARSSGGGIGIGGI
ncbi:MAG: hypothetical protein Q4E02_04480 [Lagierella massiliensis]|nr:hypothetical protein [Lagierella massiliensis]